ncbi:hypothetical protein Pmar_PMAR015447 [Perkinsus marinus ATCC 50983]|uniref:Uncharacterized protein n=1 Tax=Perkinsus marinus (strain ATCC 50983 / TXsc) TaxID=423536 RepID=C5L882_PERM5|nr:hypothetical protein Pmar_PMAR015447 [Perkinsus marinus ATCC 50983]EER07038.1 hypothetical protein Pmar_PMAR015447 [Perkinsus marinus ATCC 50983]|eukprot:XP_002775222.1 hypothetical protein Pmar_PMAR015447 [Perkinsus marinus ATCC 50983]
MTDPRLKSIQADPRKEYIVEACMALLGIGQKYRNIFRSDPGSNGELEKFLEDLNSKVLFASENSLETTGDFRNVILSTKFDDLKAATGVVIVFIKMGVGEISADSMKARVITTTLKVDDPVEGLEGVLREVHSKLLGDTEVGGAIEKLIAGLEAGLVRESQKGHNFGEDEIDHVIDLVEYVEFMGN